MPTNKANLRAILIDIGSKLQLAESRLRGGRTIRHKPKHLELQECCETLLEVVNREFGDAEKQMSDVGVLELAVESWSSQLEHEGA